LILSAGWRREKGRDRDNCNHQAFHNAEIVPPQPEEARNCSERKIAHARVRVMEPRQGITSAEASKNQAPGDNRQGQMSCYGG
jgi:hypothetical protein